VETRPSSLDGKADPPFVDARDRGERGWSLPVTAFAVTVASKLGVSGAETEHMPFYLRIFFRVLSSWVHQM
jgi:hypothetical protein